MAEVAAAIDQREEEYLHKVAAKNAAHAAEMAAERGDSEGNEPPPLALLVAWILRWLHLSTLLFVLVALGALYVLHSSQEAQQHAPNMLTRAAVTIVLITAILNLVGLVVAQRRSMIGTRVLLALDIMLICGLTMLLDEVNILRSSQKKLQEVLAKGEDDLTEDAMDWILNGASVPSLVQRFVFDAPSVFLQLLQEQCDASNAAKDGNVSVATDQRAFFTQFWSSDEKACVDGTLQAHLQMESIFQPTLIAVTVLTALQVIFSGVFMIVCEPEVPGRSPKKRKRKRLRSKSSASSLPSPSLNDSAALPTTVFIRLLTFATALCGASNVIVGIDLLQSCAVADFSTDFTWELAICAVSGLSAVFAALLTGCQWKQRLASFLLTLAIIIEGFLLSESVSMANTLAGSDTVSASDGVLMQLLSSMYDETSVQTCPSIKRWLSHVCVATDNGSSTSFGASCQREFAALLLASLNFTASYLSWAIGVKLCLLLPTVRRMVPTAALYMCCISPPDDFTLIKPGSGFRQSSLEFDDALELYLTSVRSKDPKCREEERQAFEKEWTARTCRVLADVRTPIVVVSASDFESIVRTLVLRRLTEVCKMDVSLRVANDGKMLLVRIFASDNLLLATLCETETYRLQFADAIDPGRRFWHDRRELSADQRVLDMHTVKQKLKQLSVDSAVARKEVTWPLGESLARVSARVNALSRISRTVRGQLVPCNMSPPFASYSPLIQRQYLYQKYPNRLDLPETYRRSAVLRTIDCLRLTRYLLDAEFDTTAMLSNNLVTSFHCLHSASRFDLNSRAALTTSWLLFWRPTYLPGEFVPRKHPLLNLLGRFMPFRQPLQSVRDYFGESVALYFAWLAFYAKLLVLPTLAAAIMMASAPRDSKITELWVFYTSSHQDQGSSDVGKEAGGGDTPNAKISSAEFALSLGVITWGFVFFKLWERRSVWYQLQWGITTDATLMVHSSSSGLLSRPSTYPILARLQRKLGSCFCIVALGIANLLVVLTLLLAQGPLSRLAGERLAVLGSCTCQAFLVQWNGAGISRVAHALSKWEINGISSDPMVYRSAIIAKLFVLQLLNTFSGLFLLALSGAGGLAPLLQRVGPLRLLYESFSDHVESRVSVFVEMETLILAMFMARLSSHGFAIARSVTRTSVIRWTQEAPCKEKQTDETLLSPYAGVYEDYAQIVVQLGLVVMFSSVCPLAPLLAFVDCAVELRLDVLEVCCLRQRPEPEGIDTQEDGKDDGGLGLWAPCILFMLKLSVPVVLALEFFTADNYRQVSFERRVGWWLLGTLGIWVVAQLFATLVPSESHRAEEARARNAFLEERYVGHAEALESSGISKVDDQPGHLQADDSELQGSATSTEQMHRHYQERLELLRRLNVALRKHEELRSSLPVAAEIAVPVVSEKEHEREGDAIENLMGGDSQVASLDAEVASVENDAQLRASSTSEEMIVGYFRQIPGAWSPPGQRNEEVEEEKEAPSTPIKAATDAEPPAPRRLSKLFKRISPSSSVVMPPPAATAASPLLADEPSKPQTSSDAEEKEASPSTAEAPSEAVVASQMAVNASRRQLSLSPRLGFLSRKPKLSAPRDRDSDDESSGSSRVTEGIPVEQPARGRLSKLFRRVPPSSASTSPPPVAYPAATEPSPPQIASDDSPFARTELADRGPTTETSLRDQFDFLSHARTSVQPSQRFDVHHISFALPGCASACGVDSERAEGQASTSASRRRSRRDAAHPPSPPPTYARLELSGLEAVREAARRHQFDFSTDNEGWRKWRQDEDTHGN
ncbi:hypothetical protein BBJ28_00013789 [Nothophytophthora sp. Chile5]|nr:hypothetical protein BBJ28_00013789 [Nothophytophthora sp. Chile5]